MFKLDIQTTSTAPKKPETVHFLPFPLSRLPKPALKILEPYVIPAKAETQR